MSDFFKKKYSNKTEVTYGGRNMGKSQWTETMNYLQTECKDIRMNICVGCGFAKLYDDYGRQYVTVRHGSLESTKRLVSGIRIINKGKLIDPGE